MHFTKTEFEGLYILEPRVFEDARGYFFESYNKATLEKEGLMYNFIQDNESLSSYGTIRGLHFQKGDFAQAKLVRVIEGKVLDVAVDLRKNSPTFGKHIAVELSGENKKQLLIPRGFAHGFAVLSQTALFSYKCDNAYNKEAENAIVYNDTSLNIDWKILEKDILLSEKDAQAQTFKEYLTCI